MGLSKMDCCKGNEGHMRSWLSPEGAKRVVGAASIAEASVAARSWLNRLPPGPATVIARRAAGTLD